MGDPLRDLRTVLVVARGSDARVDLTIGLQREGYEVLQAADRAECERVLALQRPDVVVADVQASGVLSAIVPETVRAPVVTIVSAPTEATLEALRDRSFQVLTKPVEMVDLRGALDAAVAQYEGKQKGLFGFTSRSPAMAALLEEIDRLRDADCPVLILGETGTGKTVLARRIHTIGARPGGNFVDLNCAGLTNEFVESELFGHERGSFTGAHAAKQRLLDVAHGGTLFLDEIGDIDMRVQPRILKVLEEKRFRRMGAVREREVDVRLLAATHHDLLKNVGARTFRADLYYRISAIKLHVPPLRKRREDILPLATSMLEMLSRRGVSSVLSPSAEERLLEHPWPGNIRELKNVIESAALLRPGRTLTADDLRFDVVAPSGIRLTVPPLAKAPKEATPASPLFSSRATDATRAEIERAHIQLVLDEENGRVETAARRLGIPRSTLYWKMRRYGLRGGLQASAGTRGRS